MERLLQPCLLFTWTEPNYSQRQKKTQERNLGCNGGENEEIEDRQHPTVPFTGSSLLSRRKSIFILAHFHVCTVARWTMLTITFVHKSTFGKLGKSRFMKNMLVALIIHCTMGLSPCKMGNREFESDYHHRPIFLLSNYFRQKYLEISSCSVSLLNNIWVRVEHSLMQNKDRQQTQFQFKQAAGRM